MLGIWVFALGLYLRCNGLGDGAVPSDFCIQGGDGANLSI